VLRELAAQRFAFVFAQPRMGKSVTYFFVGEQAEQLQPIVEALRLGPAVHGAGYASAEVIGCRRIRRLARILEGGLP